MKLNHPRLERLLQRAYSAERAAAFAYIGHANSVKDRKQKTAIRQIEQDEWNHRTSVLAIMRQYDIPVSRWLEWKYFWIGKLISVSCHLIGWFMPYYFAGRLESGNVCEYFVALRYFRDLGIRSHDQVLYEMGVKEKEHEVYFQNSLRNSRLLPFFERIFGWGADASFNDVDLQTLRSVETSDQYCSKHPANINSIDHT